MQLFLLASFLPTKVGVMEEREHGERLFSDEKAPGNKRHQSPTPFCLYVLCLVRGYLGEGSGRDCL